MSGSFRLLREAWLVALGLVGVLLAVAWAGSAADRGGMPSGTWTATAMLAVPMSLLLGAGLAVSSWVGSGRWLALDLAGWPRWRRLLPLVLSGPVLVACLGGASPTPVVWEGAAPVASTVRWWPTETGWGQPDLTEWTRAPSALPLPALARRFLGEAPLGVPRGPDRAELLRRLSVHLLIALAPGLGAAAALWGPDRRGGRTTRRLLLTAAGLSGIELLSFVAAAALADG